MSDGALATEAARQSESLATLKTDVGADVQSAIGERAERPIGGEAARIAAVAADLRGKAVDDVVAGESETRRARVVARVRQLVDLAFGLVYAVLSMRFLLALLAARAGAGFSRLVTAISDPIYEPFRAIVSGGDLGDGHHVVLALLVALAVYVFLHVAVRQLLNVAARRPV